MARDPHDARQRAQLARRQHPRRRRQAREGMDTTPRHRSASCSPVPLPTPMRPPPRCAATTCWPSPPTNARWTATPWCDRHWPARTAITTLRRSRRRGCRPPPTQRQAVERPPAKPWDDSEKHRERLVMGDFGREHVGGSRRWRAAGRVASWARVGGGSAFGRGVTTRSPRAAAGYPTMSETLPTPGHRHRETIHDLDHRLERYGCDATAAALRDIRVSATRSPSSPARRHESVVQLPLGWSPRVRQWSAVT